MEELWKPIPGYEGLYEASTMGRIRTAEGKTTSSARFPHRVWKQRILKPKVQIRGYGKSEHSDERVCLWKDGEEKTFLVARLVAMTFCDFPFHKLTVNHINGNPMDNRIENLEWVTLGENIKHGFETGLYSKTFKPVTLIDEENNEIGFETMAEACRFLGRGPHYISNAISRCNYVYDAKTKTRYVPRLEPR